MNRFWNLLFALAPDDGGGGTPGEPAGQGTSEPSGDPPAKTEPPKYWSQLSPDRREKAEYLETVKDKGTLNDLVDDYVTLRKKAGRAIVVPDRENPDPEEMKAFLAHMGIPEAADGYELKTDSYKDVPGIEEFVGGFREQALSMGLTKSQAQKTLDMMMGLAKSGHDQAVEAKKAAEKTFAARLTKALDGDEGAVSETTNLYKKFLASRIGDEAVLRKLDDAGLLTDPAFVLRVAGIERELGDARFVDGRPTGRGGQKGEPRGSQGSYSAEFQQAFGANRK